jgi:hypothetical protein
MEEVVMLTIRRSAGEGIVIGNTIVITVLEVDTERVRLVIEDRNNAGEVQIIDVPRSDQWDCDVDPGGDCI